ncbi:MULTISPECIES: hypothetical protein [unclassified Bradyrhizobium]|uniref:hypothetical protein n=1 Tax=unclassified Bradyrhizobium TaxID=2631580 RepID=UPI003398C1C7
MRDGQFIEFDRETQDWGLVSYDTILNATARPSQQLAKGSALPTPAIEPLEPSRDYRHVRIVRAGDVA